MSLLEIYIPTFDRPKELLRLISSIPANDDVTITIADDSGSGQYEEFAQAAGVVYVQRAYNIGRDANLIAAVAETRADWLWVIGDDDWLLDGALDLVLAEIKKDRADRIITYSIAADSRIPEWARDRVELDTYMIEMLRDDPSLLIASTLCSANVFRTSTFDLAEGIRHFDTYYAYAWASLGATRWVVLDKPAIGVGTDHAQTVPDVHKHWRDYLDALCTEAGVAPIPVRDAAHWNFVSVEGKR